MSTLEESAINNGSASQTNWGPFYELAGVVLGMASLVSLALLLQGQERWLLVLFFITAVVAGAGAIFFYVSAAHQALKKANAEKLEQAKFKYQVTTNRLLTLKTLGVPVDVRMALRKLLDSPAQPEYEFLRNVAQDLSWERINQWKQQILTHTRTDSSE